MCRFSRAVPVTACRSTHDVTGSRALAELVARTSTAKKNTDRPPAKPHPGFCTIHCDGRSSGSPSSFPDPAFPRKGAVAYDQSRQAYSSGGCAGLARNEDSARHRLPVSPSGRQAGEHHTRYKAAIVPLIMRAGQGLCGPAPAAASAAHCSHSTTSRTNQARLTAC